MVRRTLLVTSIIGALGLAFPAIATAGSARKASPAVILIPRAAHVQDCSEFYESYYYRGFGWGSSPASGLGFGTFEDALPMYPSNSFPNWYGACARRGRYSATGTAH
jgi:hypothetical protein